MRGRSCCPSRPSALGVWPWHLSACVRGGYRIDKARQQERVGDCSLLGRAHPFPIQNGPTVSEPYGALGPPCSLPAYLLNHPNPEGSPGATTGFKVIGP